LFGEHGLSAGLISSLNLTQEQQSRQQEYKGQSC
jgi:hypothetical protein